MLCIYIWYTKHDLMHTHIIEKWFIFYSNVPSVKVKLPDSEIVSDKCMTA